MYELTDIVFDLYQNIISQNQFFTRVKLLSQNVDSSDYHLALSSYGKDLPNSIQEFLLFEYIKHETNKTSREDVFRVAKEIVEEVTYHWLSDDAADNAINRLIRESLPVQPDPSLLLIDCHWYHNGIGSVMESGGRWAIVYHDGAVSRFIYDSVDHCSAKIANKYVSLDWDGYPEVDDLKHKKKLRTIKELLQDYDWIGDGYDGIFPCMKRGKGPHDDKYGFIKENGTLITDLIFFDARIAKRHGIYYYLISNEQHYPGCIIPTGELASYCHDENCWITLPKEYEWAAPEFSSSLLLVSKAGKQIYVTRQFEEFCLDNEYDRYSPFVGEFAVVGKYVSSQQGVSQLKFGLVNKKGKELLPCNYDKLRAIRENRIIFGKRVPSPFGGNDMKYGVLDMLGTVIVEPIFDDIEPFECGFSIVRKHQKSGVIDLWGNTIISPLYDSIWRFDNHCFKVLNEDENGNREGLLSNTGTIIKPVIYYKIEHRDKGFATIQLEANALTYDNLIVSIEREINRNGEIKVRNGRHYSWIPSKYEIAGDYHKGWALVRRDGLWGFVDTSKNEIVKCKYDSIDGDFSDSDFVLCIEKRTKYRLNLSGELSLIPPSQQNESTDDDREEEGYEERSYGRYSDTYAQDEAGYSDQEIDSIFGGEPDAYWNID